MNTYLPLISVITPSFNQADFIEETIRSVLDQEYPRIEYIVIDGASTDRTVSVLKKYEDRLTWVSEPDRGQTHALNKGFRMAKGEIVCWLNADDLFLPGAVSAAVEHFRQHPEAMLVYGEGNLIDESGELLGRFPYTRPFDLWKLMRVESYILQPTTFFRKSALEAIGYLDETYNWCMDWDLWIRLGSRFPVSYFDRTVACARIHHQTKTSNGGIARLKEIQHLLSRGGNDKYLLSLFRFSLAHLRTLLFIGLLRREKILYRTPSRFKRLIRLLFDNQGVYADGSLGKRARFMFPLGVPTDTVTFRLSVPGCVSRCTFTCTVNGKPVEPAVSGSGEMSVTIPYDAAFPSPTEVEFVFRRTFVHGNPFRRRACFLRGISTGHQTEDQFSSRCESVHACSGGMSSCGAIAERPGV